MTTALAVGGRAAELMTWLRRCWPVPFRAWVRGRDLGLGYAAVVAVVSVVIAAQSHGTTKALVEQTSTNLSNMADHPFAVLVLSAFVVSPVTGLVLLIPLVIAYGELQRWLGRLATVVVVAFGHVGATLMVMTMEITALHRHLVGFNIVVKPDVGVSYGLFAAVGALIARVPWRWRLAYAGLCAVVLAVLLIIDFDFTNVGHACAFVIGVGLSWLMRRAGDAREVTATS